MSYVNVPSHTDSDGIWAVGQPTKPSGKQQPLGLATEVTAGHHKLAKPGASTCSPVWAESSLRRSVAAQDIDLQVRWQTPAPVELYHKGATKTTWIQKVEQVFALVPKVLATGCHSLGYLHCILALYKHWDTPSTVSQKGWLSLLPIRKHTF